MDLESVIKGLEGLSDYLNEGGRASLAGMIAQLRAHVCVPPEPIAEVEEVQGETEEIHSMPEPKHKRIPLSKKPKKKKK